MDLGEVQELFDRLPTESKIVEVCYRNGQGNREIRPGYLMRVFGTPLADIPEELRGRYGEGTEHPLPPFIQFGTMLDRNQVPIKPVEIRLDEIISIFPVALVEL